MQKWTEDKTRSAQNDVSDLTVAELSALLASGQASSRSIVDTYLERIQHLDTKLGSFVCTFDEGAREAANAADAARLRGESVGPLHGIPIAIKDVFHVTDYPTRAGSAVFEVSPSQPSANVVQRLENAGMIVLGKTNTVEFAYGGWGTNTVTGTPWNPWDTNVHRVPGGSSSGSAVAVAAGLVPAATGSDTGGSCRGPAAFCGCVGLKPSFGLIGRSGMVPLSPSLDVPGLLARSVADSELMFRALVGADPGDPVTLEPYAIGGIEVSLVKGLRVGRLKSYDGAKLHPDIVSLTDAVFTALERHGAEIVEIDTPGSLHIYLNDTVGIVSTEIYESVGRLTEMPDSQVQDAVRMRILAGRDVTDEAYGEMLARRDEAIADMLNAMQGIDALITPTCAQPAIAVVDVDEQTPATPFTRMVNYLDLAALSVPMGLTGEGLPAAAQIIVPKFNDPMAFRIGNIIEELVGGPLSRPAGWD